MLVSIIYLLIVVLLLVSMWKVYEKSRKTRLGRYYPYLQSLRNAPNH